ncbi:sulfatase [uncultured Alistipes sp.]|uniref:sulfatase family protein n=1 Tax=uncultured Alistipes sp. TaxID=538949 RepID=UPI00260FCFAA|nr:sulfatase [uncultured Alistipes sp.]
MKPNSRLHARPSVRLAAVPLSVAALTGCGTPEATRQPNIVIMMTDDHTCQALSCYDNRLVETPNLDRLAREGMLFENCYVANAISGPSRACILTGKYSHKNGFTDNSRTFDGSQQTFPKLLHDAGYQTAMIGKWHLNSEPQGFDFWSILVAQGEYYSPLFIENGEEKIEPGYVTDVITDKAIGWLEQRDKDRPFAMLYYHKAPHRNWMPAQRHLGIYDDKVFPEPETLLDDYATRGRAAREQEMEIGRHMWPEWDLKLISPEQLRSDLGEAEQESDANKADVKRANDWLSSVKQFQDAYNRMTDEEKTRWDAAYAPRLAEWEKIRGTASPEEIVRWKYQQYMRDYCAVIKGVDENVGRLLDYLEKIGELDNTIVIYTSDQGFFLGEHGWFDKRFMYEECQRTPLLVRYPKAVAAGTRSKALAMNIDYAPTLLDFAGVEIPADIQGRSLKGVLTSKGEIPAEWRTGVYYHYYEYPSWHSVKRHYGIRTERYKLIHFYNDVDEWELYDLQEDPNELRNRYDDPAYAAVREEMHARLKELQAEADDTDPDELQSEFFQGVENL